jgi:HAD superfamily hydrolase (TIGR01509 family)
LAAAHGHELGPAIFTRTIGLPHHLVRTLLLDHFGAAFAVDEFLAAWSEHFWRLAETHLALKPGALELLDALDALEMPRAIATSSSHRTVRHHLDAHGLAERFHAIVGHGDYAESKPAPDPFLRAAERLGVAPSLCLALEDSHNGIRSAAAAGMMTVMVPDLLPPNEEIRSLCVTVARDLHEVRNLLLPTAPSLNSEIAP